MAYRSTIVSTVVADDAAQTEIDYQRSATVYQTRDLEVSHSVVRVAPSDVDAAISIAPVAQAYFVDIRSDYPIMVRFNGSTATQLTLTPGATQSVASGSAAPDACVLVGTFKITSLYVAPIAGATQTATVRVCVTGDPASAY